VNLFSLHGKHFRDDENRLTANLAIMLNEARRGFLPAFLSVIGLLTQPKSLGNVQISLQEGHTYDDARSIFDAKLSLRQHFVAVVESKVGFNSITVDQATKYARWLSFQQESKRLIVFITQLREPLLEEKVRNAVRDLVGDSVQCVYLRWQELFSLLRSSEQLTLNRSAVCERRVRRGLPVASVERFAYLFLSEVEKMAYDLEVIDDLTVGEVEDVVVQVQHRWFMEVALNHNIWFPPSQSIHGLKPAKYVAYYQTADNELPKHVTHIAKVRKVWKRVSFDDARVLPDFEAFFADSELAATVARFKNKEGLFHIALTGKPVTLARPLPLGNPRKAQFLTKKRFPVSRLLSAETTDDLFQRRDTEEDR
jgi:hypothetical protein